MTPSILTNGDGENQGYIEGSSLLHANDPQGYWQNIPPHTGVVETSVDVTTNRAFILDKLLQYKVLFETHNKDLIPQDRPMALVYQLKADSQATPC